MNIGFIGLGKLGLPCALAIAHEGYAVIGTDTNTAVQEYLRAKHIPFQEALMNEYLEHGDTIHVVPAVADVVAQSDLVFVAVQTPHKEKFEGISRLPHDREDFDYTFLKVAALQIAEAARKHTVSPMVAVISTVLPGTIRREILPILQDRGIETVYNPFFIAMGTTIPDFLFPEFVLIGTDDPNLTPQPICRFYYDFYAKIYGVDRVPTFTMGIEEAELTKVAYNTFIGMKIVFANTLREITHKIGGNVDRVTYVLGQATARVISDRYLKAGMGDGGGCHPRDNIAMSYLARTHHLSFDLFDAIMKARERQTDWLANIVAQTVDRTELPVVILGLAYKPDIGLTVGSSSLLLNELLRERGIHAELFDPYVEGHNKYYLFNDKCYYKPAIYVLAMPHRLFLESAYPKGSVVIDPWGVMCDWSDDIEVLRLGR